MKTALLVMAVWALTAAASYGQVRAIRAGSAEHLQMLYDLEWRIAKEKEEHKKNLENGRRLFGADKRWIDSKADGYDRLSQDELKGTLIHKSPRDFRIGDWGCTSHNFRIINKVSDTECLVLPRNKGSEVMLIRGLDTSKVTDGVEFILQHPVVIQDTYDYTAVSSSQKTVLVLECGDKFKKRIEAIRKAAEDALFRNWTDSTGKLLVVAKFIEFKKGQVHLERKDGSKLAISPFRLSKADQKWYRNELKRQMEEKRKAAAKKAAAKKLRAKKSRR